MQESKQEVTEILPCEKRAKKKKKKSIQLNTVSPISTSKLLLLVLIRIIWMILRSTNKHVLNHKNLSQFSLFVFRHGYKHNGCDILLELNG